MHKINKSILKTYHGVFLNIVNYFLFMLFFVHYFWFCLYFCFQRMVFLCNSGQEFKNSMKWGWRELVKSTNCSSRGPEFNSRGGREEGRYVGGSNKRMGREGGGGSTLGLPPSHYSSLTRRLLSLSILCHRFTSKPEWKSQYFKTEPFKSSSAHNSRPKLGSGTQNSNRHAKRGPHSYLHYVQAHLEYL